MLEIACDPRSAFNRPKCLDRRDKFHLSDGRPGMGARLPPTLFSLDYDGEREGVSLRCGEVLTRPGSTSPEPRKSD